MKCSKVLIVSMAVLLVGGVALAQTAPPDPPLVFVSDPEEGLIWVINPETGFADDLDPNTGGYYEDLVFGPDEKLYACDPDNQEIIRITLGVGEGFYVEDVEYVFTYEAPVEYGSGEDLSPQCGWFTSKGDFIFTDVTGRGLWMCEDLAFGNFDGGQQDDPICQAAIPEEDETTYSELVSIPSGEFPSSEFGFYGEGVTQVAGGDALAVQTIPGGDFRLGSIFRFEMDKADGTFLNQDPLNLLDANGGPLVLWEPKGIARTSTGDIYVTGYYEESPGEDLYLVPSVQRFTPLRDQNGDPIKDPVTGQKYWVNECNIPLNDNCGEETPHFLEASADDTIWVATTSDCYGRVWTVNGCTAELAYDWDYYPSEDNGWGPYEAVGLALTPTWTPPSFITESEPGEAFISFNDHVYELTLPDGCTLDGESVLAQEVPVSCIENLIANHVIVPDGLEVFNAYPVTYLGEEAFGIVYNLEGSCTAEGEIIHAISAYTDTVNNPRILKCYEHDNGEEGILDDVCDPDGNYWCEVLELDSFFPGDGVLPDDGRIGSRGAASFSQYFVVQSGPEGYDPYNPATAGESCGFFWPYKGLTEPPPATECFGCDRPPIFRTFGWAAFRAVEDGGHCWWGPFIDDTNFLASVARVRDEFGAPVFEQMELNTMISGDQANWFRQPRRWWKPYVVKFWTYDWPEGIYLITAMDLDGGVPVFQDYFEVRHWCDNPTENGCN